MSTELAVLQNELIIAQQQNEILDLKYRLQKTQADKASRLEDSLLSPNFYEHYQKVSVMLSKSGVIPNAYKGKPDDIFVAMAMGYQLGFPVEQSLQDIAVINGRPCLWGDGLLSLALNHTECESIYETPIIDEKGNLIGYRCTVIRKGHKPHTKQFTLQDAQLAGLLARGTVWKAYPERMLQMRARSFAIRDKFADALRGLRVAEIEEEDSRIIEVEHVVTAQGQTQVDKLKSILEVNNDQDVPSDSHEGTEVAEKDMGLISVGQVYKIRTLFQEKEFSEERVQKALNYYKIDSIEEFSFVEAQAFISQLEKA
jgi:hypothetical protein